MRLKLPEQSQKHYSLNDPDPSDLESPFASYRKAIHFSWFLCLYLILPTTSEVTLIYIHVRWVVYTDVLGSPWIDPSLLRCPGTLTPHSFFPYFPGTAMTFHFLQGGGKKAAASPWIELLDHSADVWLCATQKMSLPAGSSKQVINARLRIFLSYIRILLFAVA